VLIILPLAARFFGVEGVTFEMEYIAHLIEQFFLGRSFHFLSVTL